MGFKTESDRLRRFEVKHFGISHTSSEPLPNHVEMQVFNPGKNEFETKFVERYSGVEGRVIGAEWYQREDKNSSQVFRGYAITMDIGDEIIILDVPFKQPPAAIYSLFVRHGENVDWSKPLEISAWETTNKQGKPKTGVCFWQVDETGRRATVKSAHTIEHPNGCPAPIQDELTGKPDWRNVERWLKFNFDEKVLPAIQAAAANYTPTPKPTRTSTAIIEDETDDAYEVPEFAGTPRNELEGAQQHQARKMAASAGSNQPPSYDEAPPPEQDDPLPF